MITNANALYIPLAPRSVHMVATSPPYWALRSYQTGAYKHAELGAEKLHDCLAWARGAEPCGACYVCAMRAVARELWRVLRDDGVFFLNLGDSYASSSAFGTGEPKRTTSSGKAMPPQMRGGIAEGLKHKDLAGIPWRVALALQADGWYLRSDVIWAKPNPMPESVTDRCTKSHEYVFMLTKAARYYYDAEAIKQDATYPDDKRRPLGSKGAWELDGRKQRENGGGSDYDHDTTRRNRRTVWTIATQPYAGAHYAVWPPALVEPMILAGTSARGVCSACGAQWVRVVERPGKWDGPRARGGKYDDAEDAHGGKDFPGQEWQDWRAKNPDITAGWRASCDCNAGEPVPAIVLDPFCGSGTTGAVARLHGRRFVGLDLSMEYLRGQALARAEGLTTPESLAELPMFAETLTQR